MTDIVFHHYKESPYAEKIRALLGYKNLSWRSVTVPRIAPKPDLSALTGGYRKVPVLQLGADVFCDTRLIAMEIEALSPSPAALDVPGSFASLVENWVDINLFGRAVSFTFGSLADMLPVQPCVVARWNALPSKQRCLWPRKNSNCNWLGWSKPCWAATSSTAVRPRVATSRCTRRCGS